MNHTGRPDRENITTELGRELGFSTALAIGVGTMIAAGIFTLSGLAIRNVGSGAILSFILAAVASLFTALSYCEFVSIYPRSGEGYLYARKTFPAPLAYIVGWALFLGYVSSCSFYISSLSSYFVEFILETPIHNISGLVFLALLVLLNMKGSKESGNFQVVVTVAKVLLLIWFIAGGIRFVESHELIDKFESDFVQLLRTSALVFITFFGFSAIAASAGEVKNPVRNIPRAIFWSVAIVSVLYVGVVIVIIASDLNEYTEAAMGIAATKFLGSFGGTVIVAGAIFSMVSASNASIMAGSRVALAMSQLGHLPKELGSINEKTKTPLVAVLIVGGMIALFTIGLGLEDLAHFADTVLLFALIMVNLALIFHRRKYPDIARPFKVPLVPLLPILGILINAYLMAQLIHHVLPLSLAILSLVLGFIGFLTWKGFEPEEKAIPGDLSRLAVETHGPDEYTKKARILVPVANPRTLPHLLKLAAALAEPSDAAIIVLRVLTVPAVMPLDYKFHEVKKEQLILDKAQEESQKLGISVSCILRIGHHTAKAILETSRAKDCNLILLGWKGYSSTADKILGRTTDAIVTHARRDIVLVKLSQKPTFKKILLPTAGGTHARAAENYASMLARALDADLTVCRVILPDPKDKSAEARELAELENAKERILNLNFDRIKSHAVRETSITKGIETAASDYDTIVVGATRDSFYQQILFGSIPEKLAKDINKNIIVVKHHAPLKALWGKVVSE